MDDRSGTPRKPDPPGHSDPNAVAGARTLVTDIPARLDRLPWSAWHWRVVLGLGITWLLDGLEVTLVGAVSGMLQRPETLGLSSAEIGLAASLYLAGAVLGALFFGALTDRLGRKRLFFTTLAVYLGATALTAGAWDFWSFALFRCLTGAGIGGEYAAINSAIDELIPARVRGRVDLAINSGFWAGTALGAGASLVFLDPEVFPVDLGWRLGFGIGAGLGLVILGVRRFLPESPRWLLSQGREDEAERIVAAIEAEIAQRGHALPAPDYAIALKFRGKTTFRAIARTLAFSYPRRALLGLILMAAQAFFYNAIFFTYALVLGQYYGVAADNLGAYLLPFALGNFLGPLLLGRWFDSLGRKPMIALTYGLSGSLLALTAALFKLDLLSAATQTAAWTVVFFFASAAASSAYLTVSEIFPVEMRALAIALCYAAGTALGGIGAPALFGALLESGSRTALFEGYLLGAGLMLIAAAAELLWGVEAERKPLEEIASPLTAERLLRVHRRNPP